MESPKANQWRHWGISVTRQKIQEVKGGELQRAAGKSQVEGLYLVKREKHYLCVDLFF